MSLRRMIAKFLARSSHVHLRLDPASSPQKLLDLLDRLLDDDLAYSLEWDDFISWESENTQVEAIRENFGAYERLLFSGSLSSRECYRDAVIEEREKLASSLGVSGRLQRAKR